MTFDGKKMAPVGAVNPLIPTVWSYVTPDDSEEVLSDDYFKDAGSKLRSGDVMFVRSGIELLLCRILPDGNTAAIIPSRVPNLITSELDQSKLIRPDGLGGMEWFEPDYGTQLRLVIDSLPQVSTLNDYDADPVTKVNEDIVIPEDGEYKVSVGFSGGVSSTNRSLVVGFFINGILIDEEYSVEPKDVDNNNWPQKTVTWGLTAGNHNIQVLFGRRGGGGGSVVHLKNVRIIIES